MAPYPWQIEQWKMLRERVLEGRLPHGFLFAGPAGTGKADFARAFASTLVCTQPSLEGLACGHCNGCLLLRAGTHPDLVQISPLEDKTQIAIDQIRELCRSLGLKSHAGGYKAAIVVPAERLNTAAANSLLKTLEEPTDRTVLMLVTDQPASLPATIRSRCQQLRFPVPTMLHGREWLKAHAGAVSDPDILLRLADGAPLRALALSAGGVLQERAAWLERLVAVRHGRDDPVRVAALWADDNEVRPLYWWGSFISDIIRFRQKRTLNLIKNQDLIDTLQVLGSTMTMAEAHRWLMRVWADHRLALQTSANRPLLLEALLIEWCSGIQNRRAAS